MKFATRSLTLAALAALAAPACAAEGEEAAETVTVGGFALEPMGHLTSPDGAVTVHPKALIGGGYNNNVYATPKFRHDAGLLSWVVGVDVDWAMTEQDKLDVLGEYVGEAYYNLPGRNLQGGQGTARYKHEDELWNANALASWARTNDPFIQTGEQIKHDDFALGVGGTRRLKYNYAGLGLTFDRRDYLEDTLTFGKNDRDYNDYGLNARAGHELADESEIYLRGNLDRRDYHRNTTPTGFRGFNDSSGLELLVGAHAKLWTRSALVAEVGVAWRAYRYDFMRNSAYDDQNVIAPAANVAFLWKFEPGSFVSWRFYSTLEDSVSANAAWLYGGRLDARYRLQDQLALFGALGAYELRDSGFAAPQTDVEVRDTGEITLGIEYLIHRGVGLRLKDVTSNSHSKYFNDFTRSIVSLDLGFVY